MLEEAGTIDKFPPVNSGGLIEAVDFQFGEPSFASGFRR